MMKISIPMPNQGDEFDTTGAQIIHADATPAPVVPDSRPPSIDIMALFAPGGGGQPNVSATEENLDEGVEDTVETPPVPPVTPPTPAPADALAQHTAALTKAVESLTQRQVAPAPTPVAEEPKTPKVWLTPEQVPQAMVQLLNSEDPAERVKGLAAFGNALVTMVYSQVQRDVTEQYQPQFQAMVQDHYRQQEQINNFRTDMNTNYPALVHSPAGRLVAQHVVQTLSAKRVAEGKSVNWFDPEFKSAFDAELKTLGIDPKVGNKPAAPPAPPAPQARVGRSNGARPVDPAPGERTQSDHMMGMLSTVLPRAN